MRSYNHLSTKERQKIEFLTNNHTPIRAIARELCRSHSSIIRELARLNQYDWAAAQTNAAAIRRNKPSKIESNPGLRRHVVNKLRCRWSPDQISGRLKIERSAIYACRQTIYSFIHKHSALEQMLPRYYERKRYPSNRSLIKKRENLPSISQRVSDKHILWSWETDLVHFGRRTTENVTTLFNRASKYVRIIKNKDKSCKTVLAGIYDHSEGIKILTMDRGVEFLAPEDIRRHGIEPYYCDPGCPGQKGGCENSNRRLRWWLPKRTDITKWDQEALDKVAENMNNTPRKSIGYLTPKEFYTNPPSWCTST